MAESMTGLKRSSRCALVSENDIGKELTLMGWVQRRRNLGALIFVDLRDISGLIQILPETWLYEVLVGEDPERQRMIAFAYLSIGKMDLLWEHSDVAEQWLVKKLRGGKGKAIDYINYGHCLLLRGDRMMAFENYREARTMCKSAKEFYALYRPDRNMLVEQGVPVEQIYLLEDQLLKV